MFNMGFDQGLFPGTRLRRLRHSAWLRNMVAETHLQVSDLILPLFIREDTQDPDIPSMPNVKRYSLQELPYIMEQVCTAGIPAVALFPVVNHECKDPMALEALNPTSLLLQATTFIRTHFPTIGVITDAALDAYTSHGHDGLLNDANDVDNDLTLKTLAHHALLQAQAGAQIIAPSDMMDGRVKAIRHILDDHGFQNVALLAYSAKYASALYGPFRQALQSAPCLGQSHKLSYHMDPRNGMEALREVSLDIQEHADMILIKPGSLYLDILWRVSETFGMPTFAFHVSGEYSMLKSAALQGWISYENTLMETLIAFKRAGARGILSYGALDAARLLKA